MNYYIKQKAFSWADKFDIYDENGNEVFYAEGEVWSFAKKIHLYDMNENELAFVSQKMWKWLPTYIIYENGDDIATVTKEVTFVKQLYTVVGPDWIVEGNFSAHDYTISHHGNPVAVITKKWMTWADTYEISINENECSSPILPLCVLISIDVAMAQAAAAASSAH